MAFSSFPNLLFTICVHVFVCVQHTNLYQSIVICKCVLSCVAVEKKGHSVQNIVWPPPNTEPEVPTACPLYFPPPSQVHHHQNIKPPIQFEPDSDNSSYYESDDMAHYQIPKMSICSAEVSNITNKSTFECCETISETLATQKLVENVLKNRPPSPPPPVIVSSSQSCVETKQSVQGCADDEDDQQVNCDLKRPQDFNPHIPALKPRPKKIENSVPKQWESPMVQALTTASDQPFNANSDDPFSQIPTIKRSSTAFASALSIAPAQPFTPHSASLNMEPIPLPEETVPYFPPDHSFSFSEQNVEKIVEKSDHHIKATTVPQPSLDGGPPPPILRKKKDPTEKFFAELPKPHEKLSMLTALTTASDRCYSPFSTTSSVTDERHSEQQSDFIETKTIERKQLHRPMKPTILPESFNPIITEEEGSKPVGCYPLFKGFSCSFENKTDHSQFKIEICTTPPIPANTDGNNPEVKVTRSGSNNDEECLIESETITKKMHTSEKSSQKQELLTRAIDKQAECVILKKPLPLAEALHRPDSLPQYQVNLSESVNADIELMKRIEAAQQRHDKQKTVQIKEEANIIVDNKREDKVKMQNVNILDRHSEAVYDDDKRTNLSFSPRPRSLTPSMINKPAPVLPYYQASLVAQPCHAPTINLLDPASPAVSRSPSPCPNRRCASPFETKSSSLRPKSPAAGAPPNPLKSSQPLPTQRDFRVEQAKKNVTNYIPQYKSKIDVVERAKGFSTVSSSNNMAEETLQSKNIQLQQQNSGVNSQQNVNIKLENLQVQDCQKNQILREQNQQSGYSSSMSISEKSHLAHLEQLNQSQTQSVQQSSDGRTQVQRKKTVTEEFERTQKSNVIEIEKNTTTTTKSHHHPFRDINTSSITQQEIVGMHLTNPQPLVSPFLKTTSGGCSTTSACSSSHKPAPSISGPKSGPTLSTSSKSAASSGSSLSFKPNRNVNIPNVPKPNAGTGGGRQAGAVGVAPKRGRGVLNAASLGGARVPLCGQCHSQIRGPFITALGKIWCPDHFACATPSCRRPLQDIGFVEEQGQLYCEYCFEQYLAPPCSKCNIKIKGDCLKAIGKKFHPECFNCIYCGKLFASSPFFIEDGNPYCEADWNELFTTKCFACGFPVEAGDRWVEALNNNYHSQCFNCTMCKKNLEGQSFFAKGGRPFCKAHAR